MSTGFPEKFLWGASTSPHQVEGNNFFNDWWEWETNGYTEPSGEACDHYHRFKEDFLLAKELEHNAHRLGLEWSRLEKEEGVWDQAEWNHYNTVIDELTRLGIEPIVTLNHFTIPAWFARRGGWTDDSSVTLFTRFAVKAVGELGDRIQYWITLNEPHILALLGYRQGRWPPCRKSPDEELAVLKNMLKSHVEAYRQIHGLAKRLSRIKPPKIGIAKAVTAFHPCSPYSAFDRLSTYYRSRFHNHSFISSAVKGRVLIPGLPQEKLPGRDAMDFIGLNYYFRQFIRHRKTFTKNRLGEICSPGHHDNTGTITDMGWEIYPEGLYEVVKSLSRYRLPIIITENGIATTDDTLRRRYIQEHLIQLLRALGQRVPVFGYLHWALLDNFEWDSGYGRRFGLIHVDYKSQKRTVRDSARYYAAVIRTGKI